MVILAALPVGFRPRCPSPPRTCSRWSRCGGRGCRSRRWRSAAWCRTCRFSCTSCRPTGRPTRCPACSPPACRWGWPCGWRGRSCCASRPAPCCRNGSDSGRLGIRTPKACTPGGCCSPRRRYCSGRRRTLVWDAFTHGGRWGVRLVPALDTPFDLPAWLPEGLPPVMHGYRIAQYLSSAIGLPLLAWLAYRWLYRRPADPAVRPVLGPWTKSAVWGRGGRGGGAGRGAAVGGCAHAQAVAAVLRGGRRAGRRGVCGGVGGNLLRGPSCEV